MCRSTDFVGRVSNLKDVLVFVEIPAKSDGERGGGQAS